MSCAGVAPNGSGLLRFFDKSAISCLRSEPPSVVLFGFTLATSGKLVIQSSPTEAKGGRLVAREAGPAR